MRKNRIETAFALTFAIGLFVASSDSAYMPWPNIAGLALMWAASVWGDRLFRQPSAPAPYKLAAPQGARKRALEKPGVWVNGIEGIP